MYVCMYVCKDLAGNMIFNIHYIIIVNRIYIYTMYNLYTVYIYTVLL